MTMAMERRIAFAVFAVGILIAIVALAGCGEDDNAAIVENDCAGRHSSHPTVGFEYLDGRESVRLIAPGPACGYAGLELLQAAQIPAQSEISSPYSSALISASTSEGSESLTLASQPSPYGSSFSRSGLSPAASFTSRTSPERGA